MIAFLLTIATYAAPTPQVDRMEVNHYSDKFTQVIFWQWSEQRKRYDVRGWKMVEHESQLPRLSNGRYVMRWTEFGQLREVTANRCIETHTTFDPELLERQILPSENRKPIFETTQ